MQTCSRFKGYLLKLCIVLNCFQGKKWSHLNRFIKFINGEFMTTL